jgi:HAD superfamily phosphatase (TIGR01668 family)
MNGGSSSMEKYIPDVYQKSIYTIDYHKLKDSGIRFLLFDLDNTLSPVGEDSPTDKLQKFITELKQEFEILIFSNSPRKRVMPFAEALDLEAIYFACKPMRSKFDMVMREYKLQENEVAIIGDQILTDVVGGNKVGITTVLVNPISTKDGIFTKWNRHKEDKIIKKLRDRGLFTKGKYYD